MFWFLTTADTEILSLSAARAGLPGDFPAVRARNANDLADPAALEGFIARDLAAARAVVVRVLGGKAYWRDGFDRLAAECRARGIALIALPGDQQLDPELTALCHAPLTLVNQTYEYFSQGGVRNIRQMLLCLSDSLRMTSYGAEPPAPLPWQGIYHPDAADGLALGEYLERHTRPGRPTVGVLFYRAHWMSGNLAPIDAIVRRLESAGCNALPVFLYSLKADAAGGDGTPEVFRDYLIDRRGRARIDCLINTLSFSVANLSTDAGPTVAGGTIVDFWDRFDVPVLQAIFCTTGSDDWRASSAGLTPRDIAMNVVMPEFDGRVITVAVSFKDVARQDQQLGTPIRQYVPLADRVDLVCRLATRFARLRRTPNQAKRVAILFGNYPTKNARIGNGVGLDTPASVLALLRALGAAGYEVGDLPEASDELIHRLIERCTHDAEFLTEEQLSGAVAHVEAEEYARWFAALPQAARQAVVDRWGQPPGTVHRIGDRLAIPGLVLGNIFLGIQPPRGYGADPMAIYHSPDLPPTHHYLAYYGWIRHGFQADAVLHVGKHGNLEWLPGKGVGLSAECYPELALGDLPNIYPYIINNPGEGTQAKRRSHAVIVDHLIPAMTTAETYDDLARLEQALDEYYRMQSLDPSKLPIITQRIWDIVTRARLDHDLGVSEMPGQDDFDSFLQNVDGYLCELGGAQIRDGLHVLGESPEGEQLLETLLALVRLDNGDVPSLRRALAEALGLDPRELLSDLGQPWGRELPAPLRNRADGEAVRSRGDVVARLGEIARRLVAEECLGGSAGGTPALEPGHGGRDARAPSGRDARAPGDDGLAPARRSPAVARCLGFIRQEILPRLKRTTDEIANILRGLDGRYVPAGPSGAPTRGMATILPTGRNFYSIDLKTIPSEAAWQVGKQAAEQLLAKYRADRGEYPRSVGIVVWGTSTMRTHGDDVAEILWLMGVRPVWQAESRRIRGIELVPPAELGRPRIDVTVRISGFFRDAFPNVIELLDEAVQLVTEADEADADNFPRRAARDDQRRLEAAGFEPAAARRRSRYRVFGSKPGAYGAGLLNLIDERNWKTDDDLAEVYVNWGGYAYTRSEHGAAAAADFKRRLSQVAVAVQNQDNREHDIFDSDDYFQFHGGMVAAIRALTGENPVAYFGDTANPEHVRVRDLADEARRVFRARVVNPKWIAGVMRHGYKGAFEMAATVDYLFGYDATAGAIDDWMYESLARSYLLDPRVQEFLNAKNPWALRSMAERLLEAADRGLWADPAPETVEQVQQLYLRNERLIESLDGTPEASR